jgi:hypothetical protein
VRADARAKAEAAQQAKKSKNAGVGCLGCLGVLFLFFVIGSFSSNQKSSALPPSAQSIQKTAADNVACRQNLKCLGDQHLVSADVRCKRVVEALAKYSSEWTDGLLEMKFSHYRWKNEAAGILTYVGDKVKFQNGFGAWQNMVYECDFDTVADRPIDARAQPGRIP